MNENKLLFFLCRLFSYSPFFRTTDDTQFGNVAKSSLSNIRISLISFNLGKMIIHLLTYSLSTKEKSFFKTIDLEEVCKYPDNKRANEAFNKYNREVVNYNSETLLNHKEALNYKIQQLETTKTKVFNKYLAYIAVVAFVLPLYGSHLTLLYTTPKNYILIFLVILVYNIVNLLLFFNEFIKVRDYNRTRFSSIRASESPLKELVVSLYFEWFTIKSESEFQVTLIKNIEKYIKGFVIASILLLTIYNLENYLSQKKDDNSYITTTNLATINLHEFPTNQAFLMNNDLKLFDLQKQLLYNEIDKVIIITNIESSNYKVLLKFLDIYNVNSADIIEINDNNVPKISVILIKEES